MPNWVTNIITLNGEKEEVKKIKDLLRITYEDWDGKRVTGISFDKLIPMPEELNISKPAQTEEEKKRAVENMYKYGARDWYDWRVQNWGTKWDAAYSHIKGNLMWFDTAWSTPVEFVETLSKRFPKVEIILEYADEDIGNNLGKFSFVDGKATELQEFDNELECYAFAFHIKGYTPEDVETECIEYYDDDMADFIKEVAEYMREYYPSPIRC